mmetsp:Transcript_5375/g.16622  ORF Transcript_5375/g.16622 Transcript_5375/m.16622 type:complete len:261 (+) Transcript_5375:230-1012(+)
MEESTEHRRGRLRLRPAAGTGLQPSGSQQAMSWPAGSSPGTGGWPSRSRKAVHSGSGALERPAEPRTASDSHSLHSTAPLPSRSRATAQDTRHPLGSWPAASPSSSSRPSASSARSRRPSWSVSNVKKSSRQSRSALSSESESAMAQTTRARRCPTARRGNRCSRVTTSGAWAECRAESGANRSASSLASHECCNACVQVKRCSSSSTRRCLTRSCASADASNQDARCCSKSPARMRPMISSRRLCRQATRKGFVPVIRT